MRNFFTIKLPVTALIFNFWLNNGTIVAQQHQPNQELLNNIEIMETVLDKLIAPDRGHLHYFGATDTKGYYLMSYGVIFKVSYSLFNWGIIALDLPLRLKLMENKYIYVDQVDEKVAQDLNKEIEKLKNSIIKFLGSWTFPLTELAPDEKVTVIVDFNGSFPNLAAAYDFFMHQLIASVPIHEILNYRKGIINEEEFTKYVHFDEVKSIDEDISILSNVIKTSLAHSDKETSFGVAGDVKGIYFNGYGTIFFTEVSFGADSYKRALTIYSDVMKKGKDHSVTIQNFADKTDDTEQRLGKIEHKLIYLISNYGPNLRNLKPDEWVEIAINFKGMPVKDNYNKSILRIQKKVIDDFNKERIKFEQFKKLVKITYY